MEEATVRASVSSKVSGPNESANASMLARQPPTTAWRAQADNAVSKAVGRKVLYRGMQNLQATTAFMQRGGSELAPMSTTTELAIAARYARGGGSALIFRLTTSTFMNLGADLTFVSAFPHEREFLYPPLTFIQPTGKRHYLTHDGTKYTVLEVKPHYPG